MNQPISSSPISRPVIAMMTDFGLGDGDVGVMKGVIAGITPNVHIIDITHEVAPQNVSSAAWILASAYRYFPRRTIFVCVVDPGVGSSRGAIAMHAEGDHQRPHDPGHHDHGLDQRGEARKQGTQGKTEAADQDRC